MKWMCYEIYKNITRRMMLVWKLVRGRRNSTSYLALKKLVFILVDWS
jgi:hypothetical protein